MKNAEVSFACLERFRCQVHASFVLRADALTELSHSLPLLPAIGAAVHASLAPTFRRRFSSVYEALRHARIDRVAPRAVLYLARKARAQLIAGYADSNYATKEFLRGFVGLKRVYAPVRLKNRRTLYREPVPGPPGPRGGPRKHGPTVRLQAPPPPDREVLTKVGKHTVRISVWRKLHFQEVPDLVGMLIRAEFLRPDGTPRYKRPLISSAS